VKFHQEDIGFITAGARCIYLVGLQVLKVTPKLSYVSFRASNFFKGLVGLSNPSTTV
jgi:urate oxidase